MTKIFRLLGLILEAIFDIAEEKPRKHYMSFNEAQEQFEAGLISMRECNEICERKEVI